jgi:hypothetical protein
VETPNATARSHFLGLALLVRPLALLSALALVACGGSSSSGSKDAAVDGSSSGGRSGSGGSGGVASGSGGMAGAAASGGSSGQADAAVDAPGTGGAAPGTGGGGGGSAGAGGSAASSGGAGGSAPGRGGAGGGTPQATGGVVGASGGGAAAGGASAGGGGRGGGGGVCFPACLDALAQSCPTTGTCTYAINIPAGGVNFCFANGIKAQNVTLPTNSGPTTSTVKNVDGSLCYSLDTTVGTAGILYAWKSPTGATVATATVANATMNTMVVMCDGASHTVDLASPACNGQSTQPSMTNCTLGTCSF